MLDRFSARHPAGDGDSTALSGPSGLRQRPPCCGFWPGCSTPSPAGSPGLSLRSAALLFQEDRLFPLAYRGAAPYRRAPPPPVGGGPPLAAAGRAGRGRAVPIPPICPAAWDGVLALVRTLALGGSLLSAGRAPLQGWTRSGQTASYPPWGSWPPLSSWSAMSLPFWTRRTGSSDWTGRP